MAIEGEGHKMNFIIYEDENKYIEKYKKIIHKLLGPLDLNYKIIEIKEYNESSKEIINNTEGSKIYILDIEVTGKNGLDLARRIRKTGDWTSPIIIVTSHEEFKNVGYTAKILMLNFISKCKELENQLIETLKVALEINLSNKSLCYTNKGETYRIPYKDILYIEKSLNDNICNIITKNNNYFIRKTIIELEKILSDDIAFIKTHRSCIVNIRNIKSVDFEKNTIFFENNKINLISRTQKRKLKERMKQV